MAEGPSGPDFGSMLSLINASQGKGGSGASPVLAAILPGGARDVDVGTALSLKGKGLNSDNMINKLPQGKPGVFSKLLADMGLKGPEILEGMKKVAQAAPVQQASIDQITGTSHGLGGGFSAIVAQGPSSGGPEIG